jgi:hypothetical protein
MVTSTRSCATLRLRRSAFQPPGVASKAVSRRVTPKHFISSLAVGWTDAAGENTYKVEIVSASGSVAIHQGRSIRLNGCDEG